MADLVSTKILHLELVFLMGAACSDEGVAGSFDSLLSQNCFFHIGHLFLFGHLW